MEWLPYCYCIKWSKLGKSYYGVRTAKTFLCLYESGCHPDDLFVTYPTSSKIVKAFVKEHGKPDVIEIRKTFKDAQSARAWESKVLKRLNAARRDEWLNQTDNKSICHKSLTEEHKRKISESLTGRYITDEARANMSKAQTGKKRPQWVKDAMSKRRKGVKKSAEHVEAQAASRRQTFIFTDDGVEHTVIGWKGFTAAGYHAGWLRVMLKEGKYITKTGKVLELRSTHK